MRFDCDALRTRIQHDNIALAAVTRVASGRVMAASAALAADVEAAQVEVN